MTKRKTPRPKPAPTGGEKNGVLLGMRLPKPIYDEVASIAAALGITPNAWIGAVVRRALQRREDILARMPPMEH